SSRDARSGHVADMGWVKAAPGAGEPPSCAEVNHRSFPASALFTSGLNEAGVMGHDWWQTAPCGLLRGCRQGVYRTGPKGRADSSEGLVSNAWQDRPPTEPLRID